MIRTIARTISFTVFIVVSLLATTALAQGVRVTGTISRIDTATRTIYFTDGSAVQVQPGTVITVNDREVAFESLTPGSNTTVVSTTPGTASAPRPAAPPAYDGVGTVAGVDRQTGIITLQDGRAIRLNGQSYVWQATPIESLQPGSQIYIYNGQPGTVESSRTNLAMLGTVRSVDTRNSLIALEDGSYVQVTPNTKVDSAGRPLALSDLRTGDRVQIWPHARPPMSSYATAAGAHGTGPATVTVHNGSEPPATAVVADYIEVTRQPS